MLHDLSQAVINWGYVGRPLIEILDNPPKCIGTLVTKLGGIFAPANSKRVQYQKTRTHFIFFYF